jgi:ATP-dependent helicase Lhr and Lhr-like helicase
MAAVWPSLAACQDNATPGPVVVPDHVLVRQTVADCLTEAVDADGLVDLLRAREQGRVEVHLVDAVEPSPLAHGILTGRPYTFLDGAPLEERRSRAVSLQRGLGGDLPVPAAELAPLDPVAIADLLEQVRPSPRDPDELHDLLLSLVLCRPVLEWSTLFASLEADGRAGPLGGCWVATERREQAEALGTDDDVVADCVLGHLELAGPVTEEALCAATTLPAGAPFGAPLGLARLRTGLARLEGRGVAMQLTDGRWCARHLLYRLHAATRSRRRRSVEPASITKFVGFLTRWQHLAPDTQLEGRGGLLRVLDQLQGLEVPAGDWEAHVLPARVRGYDPRWLDELCLAGEVAWGRLTPRAERDPDVPHRRGTATPSQSTPLALMVREDLPWLLRAVRTGDGPVEPIVGASADVLSALRSGGALFRSELPLATGRLPAEVDEGLWDLVARGIVTADAFSAVRSLLSPQARWGARQRRGAGRVGLARRRAAVGTGHGEGRWSLLPDAGGAPEGGEELAEAVAWQLLARWGVVMWEVWDRESFRVPWREVVRAMRRLEARGLAVGGRFVAGLSGEQYALAEAAQLLARTRRDEGRYDQQVVAASDPLNLTGTVVPGPRVPAVRHRQVTLGAVSVSDAG